MLLTARTRFLCLLLTLLLAACAVRAQDEQPRPNSRDNQTAATNYEIRLQLLVSTDQPADKIPANLQSIEKQLRRDFRSANYQTAFNLVYRAAERGTLELKGINPLAASGSSSGNVGFYEATLQNIRVNSARSNEVRIDAVRLGLRVPVALNSQVVNYEQIGITAKPLSVALGEPTIVGTLTTSRPNETIVLVLTIESSDAARNNRTAQKQ